MESSSPKIALLNVTIFLYFLILNPSIYSVHAENNAVTEFCNQRKTSADRAFCAEVLKSKPQSASAKDNPTLLKISLDLTISHAATTIDYSLNLLEQKFSDDALRPVLQRCISSYNKAINYFQEVIKDLEDDPPMVGYEIRMGALELAGCGKSLNSLNIPNESISSRHKVTLDYTKLSEEIAGSI